MNLVKRILSLILVMAVVMSCSNDDDEEPALEDVELSFEAGSDLIEVPTALLNSSDENAQELAMALTEINTISGFMASFQAPQGAVKSNTAITPINGRAAGTMADNVVVYTWTDAASGTSVAYQIKGLSDRYTFEFFYQTPDTDGWIRYVYAEEMKNRSAGQLTVFDLTPEEEILASWEWSRSGDIFTMSYSYPWFGLEYEIEYNTKTKAGSLAYFIDDVVVFEADWTGNGSGSWKRYEEGTLVEEGSW